MTEEPRFGKPEDFFEEVTRDIVVDGDQNDEPTSVMKGARSASPQNPPEEVDVTELPTRIDISAKSSGGPPAAAEKAHSSSAPQASQTSLPPLPTKSPPKPQPAAPPPAAPQPASPHREQTITNGGSFTARVSESSAPKPFDGSGLKSITDIALVEHDDETPMPTNKALSFEFYRHELWQAKRSAILITALFVISCTALLISLSRHKSSDSVEVSDSAALWSMNLDRPMIELHAETKTWTDLENQIDLGVQELNISK